MLSAEQECARQCILVACLHAVTHQQQRLFDYTCINTDGAGETYLVLHALLHTLHQLRPCSCCLLLELLHTAHIHEHMQEMSKST